MHSEKQIRSAIRPLLDIYGEMTTTEVIENIESVLKLDNEDMTPSQTRNGEYMIYQRIRNIFSHQKETIKIYPEGFAGDKSGTRNLFKSVAGIANNTHVLSENEIKSKKFRNRTFKPHKIDFKKRNEENEELGRIGEEFIVEFEKDRIYQLGETNSEKIQHLSKLQGDGLGYDISSINDDGSPRMIEVKTTKFGKNTPFFMSENERAFFELHRQSNDVFIYRVYDFDMNSRHGQVEIIDAKTLLKDYQFDPVSYLVYKKK